MYSLEEGGCNYFQLFGMYVVHERVLIPSPETYDIDLKKLELNFRNLQKVLHPDLYSTKSDVRYVIVCIKDRRRRLFLPTFLVRSILLITS